VYEAYFLERYRNALKLADEASTDKERRLHLRNVGLYLNLIDFCSRYRSKSRNVR